MKTAFDRNGQVLMAIPLVISGCFLFLGCESDPNKTIPELPSIISSLKRAKDTSEDRASMVKGASRIRFRFRRNGEELYRDARASHNEAIAYIIASLTHGAINRNELDAMLADADESRRRFHNWYDGPARNEGVAECASCGVSVGDIVDIASLIVEIVQAHNAIAVQQRQEFQQQLRACEWESWSELPSSN